MTFIILTLAIAFVISIRFLRSLLTKVLYNKFKITCTFKGLLGIREFSFKKALKDLTTKKLGLNISNLRIKYLNNFRFRIHIEKVDCAITLSLIQISIVKSFVSDNEKVGTFLYNVLQIRGEIIRIHSPE